MLKWLERFRRKQTPVPEQKLGHEKRRFVVTRTCRGEVWQNYCGDNGAEANRAWLEYKASGLEGEFNFIDRQHEGQVRATFVRR